MSRIGFIGLGAMGAPMAHNLHAAGHELRVWNRDRAKARQFANKAITVVDSPAAAAAGAEFVVSMVADDVATRQVMLGANGVLESAAPGTVVIDSSTNTPGAAREVAAAAAARGVDYLDAPVTGSIAQAQNRELVFIVGGSAAAFAKAQPVLDAMGRMSRHVGPPGAGATLKLVNNMLAGSLTAALAETVAVAGAAGLDPATVTEILSEGAAGSRLVKVKVPKMFKRDFAPQFQLELMEKDLRYFLTLAQELDVPAPIASLARSRYQEARRANLGKLDTAAMIVQATGTRAS